MPVATIRSSAEVRRYIALETHPQFVSGKLIQDERYELTGYAQR